MNIICNNTVSARHGSTDDIKDEFGPSFLDMLEKKNSKNEKNKNAAHPSSKDKKLQDVEQGADILLLMRKSNIDCTTCIVATSSICREVTPPHNSNKKVVVSLKKKKRTMKKAKSIIRKRCQFRIKGNFYVKGDKVITQKDKLCINAESTAVRVNLGNVRCNVCFKFFCHLKCRNCFSKHTKQWENKKCEKATFTFISKASTKE